MPEATGTTMDRSEDESGIRALLRHARPHRAVLGTVLGLTLASSAAGLAQPLVAQDVLSSLSDGRAIGGHLLLLVGLLAGSAVLTSVSIWLSGRTSERIVLRMRKDLIFRLLRLRTAEAEKHSTGDLTTRVTSDTVMLQAGASGGLVQVLDGALTVVAAFVLMAVLDLSLFGVTCAVLVIVAVLVGVIVPRIRATSRRGQEELGGLGASLERALSATRTVKAASAERFETERAEASALRAYRAGLKGARYDALIGVISGMAIQASFLVVIGVGGFMVAAGSLEVATLVAFLLFLFRIMGPVASLITGVGAVSQAMGALSRIGEIGSAPIEDDVDDADPRPARRAPALTLDDVTFAYPGRAFRLDGVSLRIEAGSRVAIVGPSGAGKTTVFSLVERFHDPDSGRILLDGQDVTTTSRARLRSRIAYVEQDSTMLAGSLRDNLCYGLGPVTDDAVAGVLAATELTGFVDTLPDGLDSEVGARGAMLSGGQRQRLAIARALLREPDVLLLDESTAALDARNEEALRRTVAAASRTSTVVMIAHRLSTVTDADKIVVLQDGRIRDVGPHHELLSRDALYRELATTQLLAPEAPGHADVGADAAPAPART